MGHQYINKIYGFFAVAAVTAHHSDQHSIPDIIPRCKRRAIPISINTFIAVYTRITKTMNRNNYTPDRALVEAVAARQRSRLSAGRFLLDLCVLIIINTLHIRIIYHDPSDCYYTLLPSVVS